MGVAHAESNGWKNPYEAKGPRTASGNYAWGKYQVMDYNIPVWTEQHLGKRMTVGEFVASPLAQEKLAGIIFTKRIGQRQNTHDPIAIWFSGQPLAGNMAQDITGTTVPQYVARILHINVAHAAQK